MSSKRSRTSMVLTVVLLGLPFTVAAGNGGVDGAGREPRNEAVQASHDRIVEFWTPERVARAVPRDFYRDPGTGAFSPTGKPGGTPGGGPGSGGGGGGGGEGGDALVSGQSWSGGGDIDGATGKVLFQMGSSYYVCSATAIGDTSGDRSLVLTAAHCVYDETTGTFASNWMFVPDYDDAPAPLTTSGSFCEATAYGCWTPVHMVVHSGYATAGGFNDQAVRYDFAVVAVGSGGHGATLLEDQVVEQGFDFTTDAAAAAETGWAFGYPAEKKWKGDDLVYCKGPIDTDPYNDGETYRMNECRLNGGSSGGPWLVDFSDGSGSGTVVSVNSYGYTGINAMHGPPLNADARAVYEAALGGNGTTVVP